MKHLKLSIFVLLFSILPLYSIAQGIDQQEADREYWQRIEREQQMRQDKELDEALESVRNRLPSPILEPTKEYFQHEPVYDAPSNPATTRNNQSDNVTQKQKTFDELVKEDLNKIRPKGKSLDGGIYDRRDNERYSASEHPVYGVSSTPDVTNNNQGNSGVALGCILFICCIGAFFWFNAKSNKEE